MGKTNDNLQAAFAGESQASQRYIAFAARADQDGLPMVARLFRAAATAERVHAQNHVGAMGVVGDTAANLKTAVSGEEHELTSMYPGFLATAKQEGNDAAEETFNFALKVECIHHQLYGKALKAVEGGKDLPEQKMFVCRVCGNTVEGEAPDECPICGALKRDFMEIQ